MGQILILDVSDNWKTTVVRYFFLKAFKIQDPMEWSDPLPKRLQMSQNRMSCSDIIQNKKRSEPWISISKKVEASQKGQVGKSGSYMVRPALQGKVVTTAFKE